MITMHKKTTPDNVREAHLASYHGKLNMVAAANHCGMTLREFKMTFHEFLKYHPASYDAYKTEQLALDLLC